MEGDRDMMLSFCQYAGKPRVTAGLPGLLIAESFQQPDQFLSADFAWNSHAAMTSSLTICNRIRPGRSLSSKWQ